MSQKSGKLKVPAEKVVKDIRRATRKRHSSENIHQRQHRHSTIRIS